MVKLGKCLVFYLKYPAEMNQLYWDPRETGEKPRLNGLKDSEKVMTMIESVGDAACREAAAFLETCAERIEPQLQSVGAAHRKRRNLETTWAMEWKLIPKRLTAKIYVGVWINEHLGEAIPWIWCRGGRRAEDEMTKILGRGIKARSTSDLTKSPGLVALARVRVNVPTAPHDFDVDQDPLVAQVCKALSFDAGELKAIARIVARNGE